MNMNEKITITTNNHWRNFLYGYELPEKVKPDFDWIDKEVFECSRFLKYRGWYYTLEDFMSIHNKIHYPNPPVWMKRWDGYNSDSFFSGVLIKISDDGEQYKIATYIG